jgi:phosphatidylserine decarboxylase
LTLGEAKHITHTESKTLNPEWNEQCELPVAGVQSLLLDVCAWDKDRFGKDYLGEFDLALEEIFANGKTEQMPRWFPLKSKRPGKKTSIVSGEVLLQFTLVDSTNAEATDEQIFEKFTALVKSGPGADTSRNPTPSRTPVLAPVQQGKAPSPSPPLGERRAEEHDEEDEYDVYDDETPEDEDPTKPEAAEKRRRKLRIRGLKRKKRDNPYEFINGGSDVVGIIFLEIGKITDLPPESNLTKTSFDMDPFVVASLGKKTYRTKTIRHNLNPVFNEKMIFQVLGHEQMYSFAFTVIDRDKYSGNDFIASVNFPVKDLIDKAPKADPETGLYNLKDVPDFSAPAQRPRFMRLGLSRTPSTQSLSKLTRPALSKSPSMATTGTTGSPATTPAPSPGASQILDSGFPESPQPAVANTGLLHPGDNAVAAAASTLGETTPPDGEDPEFIPYTLPLKMKNLEKWEDKHNPQLFIRAKYMPYPALRQQFWRAMLKQYDTDESGRISKVELSTMLDTLGSTLRESTIDSFFQRFPHKASDNDDAEDLTMDEAVICLEDQLQAKSRPQGMAERVKNMLPDAEKVKNLLVPAHSGTDTPTEGLETPSESQTTDTSTISVPELSTPGEEGEMLDRDDLNISTSEEHVVEIRECPICHQPRLNKRKDADIITHIATCASQDWRQVNNLMMGGFVTSSQAQRKWYSKVITKISYGGYKLGANSANILVQDRITGQINEEKMSVYVRLGIRLLYKGLKSNSMEKKRSKYTLQCPNKRWSNRTNTVSPQTPQEPQHQAGQKI